MPPTTQSTGASEALAELRRMHEQLARTIEHTEAVFIAQKLPDTRSPERADLVAIYEQTAAVATALADFLDALDRALANEGSGASQARLSPAEVRAFLLEVEPLPTHGPEYFHPGAPRRLSPIGKLPGAYAYHVHLDNQLYDRKIPRSYAWRESMGAWQAFTYFGGSNAVSGLLARLDRISDIHEVRTEVRTSEGGGALTVTEDGRRVMTFGAVAPKQSYPWDRRDIDELRRIAARTGLFAALTDEGLLAHQRREWCEMVDLWLPIAPSVGAAAESFLISLIRDTPPADAAVNERLTQLASLDCLSEGARAQARAKIG